MEFDEQPDLKVIYISERRNRMIRRMLVREMKIEIMDNTTGELLTLRCTPDELPRVMEIFNTLNNVRQFAIHRIYTSGDVEKFTLITSAEAEKLDWIKEDL